jgi:DNA-binding PadR family transcriptional regulator
MPHATYYRALKDLVDAGLLINRATDARPRYYPTDLAKDA